MTEHKQLAKLLETQVSLSEWIQRVNHDEAAALTEEDNYKRDRLGQVNKAIGLPTDTPTKFEAVDLTNRTQEFKDFLTEHGDELCALRLVPKPGNSDLPKLRMRGKSIRDVLGWFDQQNIDPEKYMADFVPHAPDSAWSTIFIVNDKGIFGEIHFGGHHVLTQGMYTGAAPHVFSYDFSKWQIDPSNDEALRYLKGLVELLKVDDSNKRETLQSEVKATFSHNYLRGYFETTHSKVMGTWFIDYNRILGELYGDFQIQDVQPTVIQAVVKGRKASGGQVRGMVVLADTAMPTGEFPEGGILVCAMTSPDYLPLMQKAAAIVTDQGGVLCHAAIVAREIKKPCIVGTGNATSLLHNGEQILVDADNGTVARIA